MYVLNRMQGSQKFGFYLFISVLSSEHPKGCKKAFKLTAVFS